MTDTIFFSMTSPFQRPLPITAPKVEVLEPTLVTTARIVVALKPKLLHWLLLEII